MTVVCVHRPKMGSSQSPKGSGPFGCKYPEVDSALRVRPSNQSPADNFSDGANLRPPSPRGDPILDPSDSTLLGSFYTNLESNEYTPSYEGLNFSDEWYGPSVPSLLGHTTSFGSQAPPDLTSAPLAGIPSADFQDVFSFGQNIIPVAPSLLPPPPRPQLPPQQTQTALQQYPQHYSQPFQTQRASNIPMEQNAHNDAAALLTTLYSGHQTNYPPNTNSLSSGSLLTSSNLRPPRDPRKPASQSLAGHGNPAQPANSAPVDEMTFTNMFFGTPGSSGQRPGEQTPLAWGSDHLFQTRQHYEPPLEHESSQALEEKRVFTTTQAIIPNTRSSSPTGSKDTPANTAREHPNDYSKDEEILAMPASKRRKSKARMEGDEDDDHVGPIPPKATARKRKSKGELKGSAESTSATQETPGKRRKSAASQPKPPRENLTDAQKRENHIKSEQKRRGAIKEGFDDLNYIVPTLQPGGYSKSTMLNMAGDWLEALIKDNERMSENLSR